MPVGIVTDDATGMVMVDGQGMNLSKVGVFIGGETDEMGVVEGNRIVTGRERRSS